jgi:hypothetical protein
LTETAQGIRRQKYVREIIITSLKAWQEGDKNTNLKLKNATFKEMRFPSRVFGPYRNMCKVVVFSPKSTPYSVVIILLTQDAAYPILPPLKY